MFQVYNKNNNKVLYVGRSINFALSFVDSLNRRGIPNTLVIK